MNLVLERFCAGSNVTPAQLAHFLDPERPVSRAEQLQRLHQAWYPLYWQAVRARGLVKQQYRNFSVGCALLAFRNDVSIADGRWKVFYGMNAKVNSDSRPVCAEPVAIGSAYAAGYTEVIGMVVVGETQEDDQSGLYPPTLHPCHQCRTLMKGHPILTPRTRILTALPPEGTADIPRIWELNTFKQILLLHGEL